MNQTQFKNLISKLLLKKVLLALNLLMLVFSSYSITLSDKAKISIITIGPYQPELYSAFGHSGIRVFDPNQNIDWMYDYGRFDFEQKNFYSNFAQGLMLYSIGRNKSFPRVLKFYSDQDRYVYEQVLNLSPEQTQQMFDYLENNYLPENREYLYNYVYDNCATKIRDVITDVFGSEKVSYYYGYAEEGKSVRDLMHDYLDYQPWGELIIDIGLGSQIDGEADPNVYMFLPNYIFYALEKATIKNGGQKPLVSATNKLYEKRMEPEPLGWFTPFNFFILLFFVVGLITNRNFKTLKRSKWIDYILFTVIGIFGWWLFFLWVGTEHLSKANWNLLWAFPLYIPFVYLTHIEKLKPYLARFFRFMAVLNLLTLVFWAFIPQDLNQALLPLLVTMMLRSFYISYDLGRIRFKS